jgi:hypothetical protein
VPSVKYIKKKKKKKKTQKNNPCPSVPALWWECYEAAANIKDK